MLLFFSVFKGLKKSSEQTVRYSGSSASLKKLSKSNNGSTTTTSSVSAQSGCSSSSSSSVSSSMFNQNSQSLSPCPIMSVSSPQTSLQNHSNNGKNKLNFNQIKRELHNESTDDEEETPEEQAVKQSGDSKQSNGGPYYPLTDQMPQRELIKPKYVVSFEAFLVRLYRKYSLILLIIDH